MTTIKKRLNYNNNFKLFKISKTFKNQLPEAKISTQNSFIKSLSEKVVFSYELKDKSDGGGQPCIIWEWP